MHPGYRSPSLSTHGSIRQSPNGHYETVSQVLLGSQPFAGRTKTAKASPSVQTERGTQEAGIVSWGRDVRCR